MPGIWPRLARQARATVPQGILHVPNRRSFQPPRVILLPNITAKQYATRTIRPTHEFKPTLQRRPDFRKLTEDDVSHFRNILGRPSAVIDGLTADAEDDIEPFNTDWMHKYRGCSQLVLKPRDKHEMSKILRYCNERRLAVVPQGGNTGLVGGSVPVFDEVVISTTAMNKIRSFDEASGILTVDAGVILETADQYLAERGHIFPLDLGAKGSCNIGGVVATNAGGLRVLRYGTLTGNVLGLEVVLPDGRILESLSSLRKDNTGYNLKQLFIGSEGTLGIITGISILTPPRPKSVNVAYLALDSFEKVRRAYREAQNNLSETLSAFEMMDGESQNLLRGHNDKKMPLEGQHPFYCVVETSGSNSEHDSEKMERFLEHIMSEGIVEDGVLAQDESQIRNIWHCREGIAEVINGMGGTYKYDLSIPLLRWYQMVEDCRERLKSRGFYREDGSGPVNTVLGYGHVGDCNLHLNISVKEYSQEVHDCLEPWIYEWIQKNKGSISAEHGLGFAKKDYIKYAHDDMKLDLMRQLKTMYDPNGILNPYKYI